MSYYSSKDKLIAVTGFALASIMTGLAVNAAPEESKYPNSELPPLKVIRFKGTGYKGTASTPQTKKGEKLYDILNCGACHSIHNVGGSLAPFLDGIGGRRTKEYMETLLTDSEESKKKYRVLTSGNPDVFEHNRISSDSAGALVTYLMSIPDPAGGYVVQGHTRTAADQPQENKSFKPAAKSEVSTEGAKIYNDSGCVACHSIGGVGGWMGPSLDGVGGRRSREFIAEHITDARAHSIKTAEKGFEVISEMPHFKLNKEQIEKIVKYLETVPNRNK